MRAGSASAAPAATEPNARRPAAVVAARSRFIPLCSVVGPRSDDRPRRSPTQRWRRLAPSGRPRRWHRAGPRSPADAIATPGFRGCAFYNASAESGEDSVAGEIGRLNRDWTRELLTDLARQAGAHDPEGRSAQLMILYDGTLVGARMEPEAQPAVTVRAMVAT